MVSSCLCPSLVLPLLICLSCSVVFILAECGKLRPGTLNGLFVNRLVLVRSSDFSPTDILPLDWKVKRTMERVYARQPHLPPFPSNVAPHPSPSSPPCLLSAVLGRLLSLILTFLFAAVGSFIGAMTGALIGQATESGFFRGACVGSISGAVFSLEVYESSLLLWRSDVSGYWSLLYMIDIFSSLLSGRLVREKIGPAMLSAVQSQMSFLEANSGEVVDLFSIGGTRGLSDDLVEKLPKVSITRINSMDSSGEKISCSVCLQDLQLGETVRCLPHCQHMFHLPCIDRWLLRHGSCPLCRRDL